MSQAAYHGPWHGGCALAEVLYRQRLQVERDLLRIGTIEPPHERSAVSRIVEKVADLIS